MEHFQLHSTEINLFCRSTVANRTVVVKMSSNQLIADQATALLEGVKEVIAAGFRCPQLLAEAVSRLPPFQRTALATFGNQLRSFLESAGCKQGYREAILGIYAQPSDDVTVDTIPVSWQPGLVHGDRLLCSALFRSCPPLAALIVSLLGSPGSQTYEALTSANMLWLQKHPLDVVAVSVESLNGAAQVSTKRKDLGAKLRQLLALNLQLHFPPEVWVPILNVRDQVLHTLAEGQRALAECKAAPGTTAELREVAKAMDAAASALAMPRIESSPAEVRAAVVDRVTFCMRTAVPVAHALQAEGPCSPLSPLALLSSEPRQRVAAGALLSSIVDELQGELVQLADEEEEEEEEGSMKS